MDGVDSLDPRRWPWHPDATREAIRIAEGAGLDAEKTLAFAAERGMNPVTTAYVVVAFSAAMPKPGPLVTALRALQPVEEPPAHPLNRAERRRQQHPRGKQPRGMKRWQRLPRA